MMMAQAQLHYYPLPLRPTLSLNATKLPYPNFYPKTTTCLRIQHNAPKFQTLKYKAGLKDGEESHALPYVQNLREFPKKELAGKVVMVRFDSTVLLGEEVDRTSSAVCRAVYTVKYLCEAGARVVLVSDWSSKVNPKLVDAESVAEFLSFVLKYRVVPLKRISINVPLKMEGFDKADVLLLENLSQFKEEATNCIKFAEVLSSGVDIFVNDCFSQSHRMLASTVSIARFCYACLAGFHFEESLGQLRKASEATKRPYIAIIGGGNLSDKKAALRFLASRCDGLIFAGMMSFQIMHALGIHVPSYLLENGTLTEALDIIPFGCAMNIPLLFPKDFWCVNNHAPEKFKLFSALSLMNDWIPVDLGPKSLDEIYSTLKPCKKIIWIGPVKFKSVNLKADGSSTLAKMLCKLSQSNCEITTVGDIPCNAIAKEAGTLKNIKVVKSATIMWEFFKGRKLPGVLSLDRAYPFEIKWDSVYRDPAQPLLVDIGSGNGLFIFGMARRMKNFNFLGLEINNKLARRCLDTVHKSGIQNVYFIGTNATSTFRSIVSSYPGKLALVSIQCPNPDFNKPNHRWRMLQRSLIEAIADLLMQDGKVFLQSDVEAVAVRMKEQFLEYSKGRLTIADDTTDAEVPWLKENPFGVRSDWEQHVLDRGAPMYRLMLSKPFNEVDRLTDVTTLKEVDQVAELESW